MIIRIHNTGDPYKLPTLSVPSFPCPRPFFYRLFVFSIAKDRPSRSCRRVMVTFARSSLYLCLFLILLLSKKVHIPLSISLYPFAPSPWFLPYGQMLPYNDLFLHLIPDPSSTFSLPFLRPAFSRLSRNTTRRVTPRGLSRVVRIGSPSAHLCLKRCG